MSKKITLKRTSTDPIKSRIGYKIDYSQELNQAQYEAVMHNNGPALVIAGAGTGKTRTLVYRVARLIEDGVPPDSLLLLTFTRKAAAEMIRRAATLLDGRCERISGGTFHSFSLNLLRKYSKKIFYESNFNVIDQSDSEDIINFIRNSLDLNVSKKRFPRKQTIQKVLSLASNRCESVENTLTKEYPAFIDFIDQIEIINLEYIRYKKKYNLMDYDDLQLNFAKLLSEHSDIKKEINAKYRYIMVDEYQDTNKIQHEIVSLLAGPKQNIVAVGDDAQSIYAFRGANYKNIMSFPESFKDCKIYKIEENYRSGKDILNLSNHVIQNALHKFDKNLFTRQLKGDKPLVISASNERQQSQFVAQQVLELREEGIEMENIAVLMRSGFNSFDLEIELSKANIPYRKFGGIKFIETSHIKDVVSYLRVLYNPRDSISWQRILLLQEGIGPKTALKTIDKIIDDNLGFGDSDKLGLSGKSARSVSSLMKLFDEINYSKRNVSEITSHFMGYYKDILKQKHDDWQKRWRDLETFLSITERYKALTAFLNDIALDPPNESFAGVEADKDDEEFLTLSTIHSAKGLEWQVVFIIWALEGRFPSMRAYESEDNLEEERRLFYVACTRAKEKLLITYPTNIYDRESGYILSERSRFIQDLDKDLYEDCNIVEEDDSE